MTNSTITDILTGVWRNRIETKQQGYNFTDPAYKQINEVIHRISPLPNFTKLRRRL